MKFIYSLIAGALVIAATPACADYIITSIDPQPVSFTCLDQPVVAISHENGSIYLIKDGQIVQEFKPKYSLPQKIWYGLKWGLIMRFGLLFVPLKDDACDIIATIYGIACGASLE